MIQILITAIRLLLVVPFALLTARTDERSALLALIVWFVAVATDYLDGYAARYTGDETTWGGAFDHTTDFFFVTGGLISGVLTGVVPWVLPVLVVIAFSQYTIDSYWIHRGNRLRGSKLGRYNGLAYYAPACLACLIRLGWLWVRPFLTILVWMLVITTVISISERLVLSWRARSKNLHILKYGPSAGNSTEFK